MPLSPRKHEKLNNSKNASVSLENLLGLLSSAYGTEELDSTIIFENDTVNWKNISVENLKAIPKKDDSNVNTVKKEKVKENLKMNASTSTSSLHPDFMIDGEVDETLGFIKSLVNIHQVISDLEIRESGNDNTGKSTEATVKKSGESPEDGKSALSNLEIDCNQKQKEESLGNDFCAQIDDEITSSPVLGFYVDDSSHTVIFDIQFVRKTINPNEIKLAGDDPEISFNVSDISKQMKATVNVAKSTLVSKVRYFADVEKEYGIENFDVIVKCKFGVFQWILQWIKTDMPMCKPHLNITNLKSIMSLSYNLGINDLIKECLDYLKQNFKSILDSDREIEDVLDSELLLDFTQRFTNSEIDQIDEEYESIKSKMFCSLIRMLAEPKPSLVNGHFSTLSTIFQCNFCEKIMHNSLKDFIPCRTDRVEININGELVYHHQCSPFWNMTDYIGNMYEELKCWRKVYWRLWGICHFSFCEHCKIYYPLCQSEWCPYHPEEAEYFPRNNQSFYPVGSYGCCGETVFKYNVIKPYSGCKHQSHVPKLDTTVKVQMNNTYLEHTQLISCPPPDSPIKKRFIKLVKQSDAGCTQGEHLSERFCWEGIRLAPKEKKDYSIIPQEVLNYLRGRPQVKKPIKIPKPLGYGTQVPFGKMPLCKDDFENNSKPQPSMGTMRPLIRKSNCKPKLLVRKGKSFIMFSNSKNRIRKKKSCLYQPTELYWAESDSKENNTDNQSDFEEIAMRKLVNMLNPRNNDVGSPIESPAGSYIRLEAEWLQRNFGPNIDKTSSTVVNRTFPQSWFRKPKQNENEKQS